METPQDLYRRLQCHLDTNMPYRFPETESGVEIDLLKQLFSPDEARVALEISSLPDSIKTIGKRLRKSNVRVDDLENMLENLEEKGALLGPKYWRQHGFTKGRYYSKALFVVGIYEFQAGRLSKEFGELAHRYLKETYIPEMLKTETMQLRSIPISESLTVQNRVAPFDSVKDIIEGTTRPIVVIPCVCREAKSLMGRPCKSGISETCLLLNDLAEMYIEFGRGRILSKKEALDIVKTAEKKGFVLQPTNNQTPGNICCCCSCCCESLENIKIVNKPSRYFHTNFYSRVDPDKCRGCAVCTIKCPMDSVTIVNKAAAIDKDRCIGCGVCIPACPDKAISLVDKAETYTPPKSSSALYKKLLVRKYGALGLIGMVLKNLMKKKL